MRGFARWRWATVWWFLACGCGADVRDVGPFECRDTLPSITHPEGARFQAYLDEVSTAAGVPGATMLVEQASGVWYGAHGLADLETQEAMNACRHMKVASIEKLFLAAVTLKLFEDGAFESLDARVAGLLNADLVQEIANLDAVTWRQILNHSTGIPNYSGRIDYGFQVLNDPFVFPEETDLLSYIHGVDSTMSDLGLIHRYSNSNYIVIRLLLEAISGSSINEVFESELFAPLGLQHSYINLQNDLTGRARGYQQLDADSWLDVTFFRPRGELTSNVFDINRLLRGLFVDGYLAPGTLAEMRNFLTILEEDQEDGVAIDGYGLGLMRWQATYSEAYGHNGATFGHITHAFYFPREQTTVVLLMNGAGDFRDVLLPLALFHRPIVGVNDRARP